MVMIKYKPSIEDRIMCFLYEKLKTFGAVDITPGVEKKLCISRRTLLKAARRLVEDPADLNLVMILKFEKGPTIIAIDDFRLSDFSMRYIP